MGATLTDQNCIHPEDKVFSVTFVDSVTKFDGYRPNYRHLTPKIDQNGFCPAHFLDFGNGSPDEILLIFWYRRIGKCVPKLILAF
jgi:hypothetical protein